MVWGSKKPKMKPGQIFHVPTMRRKMNEQFDRESEFVRHRRLPCRLIDTGIPARMPHQPDTRVDETLGIPVPIANHVRRRSASCSRFMQSFMSQSCAPSSPYSAPGSPVPQSTPVTPRRRTTIEIVREEKVQDEVSDASDNEGDDNVFCTTPLITSPTRPQFSASMPSVRKQRKTRSTLTETQLDEVWSRRVGPGIRISPEKLQKKRSSMKALSNSMKMLSFSDQVSMAFGSSGIRNLKRKRSSGGPNTSTPIKPKSPLPLTPGYSLMDEGTTFAMPGTSSGARKKAPKQVQVVKSRKKMRLTHDLTEQNLAKMSGIRRKLFDDITLIEPTGRY